MEQVEIMKKPEITIPGGYLSQYGGYTGFKNHYYAMRPHLWSKEVKIPVKKEEVNVTEPAQQGADPNEKFEKAKYSDKSFDIMKNIKYENYNEAPDGMQLAE